ncbi:MAG: hypothetical protein IJ392_02485 [Clostridia bacterium]|nr:hypothetical protein [Clostridia bacterium]
MDTLLKEVWSISVSIGTSKAADAWTYAPLSAGIESFEENLNGQNQQYFFLSERGYAHNEVTGLAPQYTVSGKRVYGDAAQDYICSLKYKLGAERKTSLKLEWTTQDGKTVTTVCDATILDISDVGGATVDNVPFSCVIALDGCPEITTE